MRSSARLLFLMVLLGSHARALAQVALMLAVGLVGCYLPAQGASRVDPLRAIRAEEAVACLRCANPNPRPAGRAIILV